MKKSFGFALLFVLGACSSAADDSTVSPRINVSSSSAALSADSITAVKGTYSACKGHVDDSTWTATLSGGPAVNELSVRKNDHSCALVLTDILTPTDYHGDATATHAAGILLTPAYEGSAEAFYNPPGGLLAFYANAKNDGASSFADNFTISIVVSDSPSSVNAGNKTGNYKVVTASVSASTMPSPTYTASFAPLVIEEDANNIVLSETGYAQLTEGAVVGQDYLVFSGALAATYSEVDAAWRAMLGGGAVGGGSQDPIALTLQVPANLFRLTPEDNGMNYSDLTAGIAKTIVIRNTDDATHVSSYQIITVTFVP